MTQVMESFADVNAYLQGLMSEMRSREEAYTLENMRTLMTHLGNPQDTYKTVHIAGTSGKSSTCYYLSALIRSSGQKVGMHISPHVDEVNERVQINGKPLAEKKFCREFTLFLKKIADSGVKPTYFEMLVAFSFWEFAREKVDYAVIEVGMGGLLDGTNVLHRPDKVCVITDIGFDHTATLGMSLTSITAQKAGIILPTNVVFAYEQDDEVMDVLREVCDQQQAILHEVWPLKAGELPKSLPLFQRRNWYLAYSVYQHLIERDGLSGLNEYQLADSTETYIPGRMETLQIGDKTLILDAGHNPQKLGALVKSIKHSYPKQNVAALVGFIRTNQGKVRDNLEVLLPIVSHLIATDFSLKAHDRFATEPINIVKNCDALGFEAWELERDPAQALSLLLNRKEDVLLVTGSFFLISVIHPLILELKQIEGKA